MADKTIMDELFKTIDIITDHKLYTTEYVYTEDCIIVSQTADPYSYIIQHENEQYDAVSLLGESFEPGQNVVVLFTDYSRLTKKIILFSYLEQDKSYKILAKTGFLDGLSVIGQYDSNTKQLNSPTITFETNYASATFMNPKVSVKNSSSNQTKDFIVFKSNFSIDDTSASVYVPVLTTLQNAIGYSHNENLRLPDANNGYASIHFGGDAGSTIGTGYLEWTLYKDPNGNFVIDNGGYTRLRLTNQGKLGIGTTYTFDPDASLDVFEETTSDTNLLIRNLGVKLNHFVGSTLGTTFASIKTDTDHDLRIGRQSLHMVVVGNTTSGFTPFTDNAYPLGSASKRWSVVYATNGAIQTSDKEAKYDIDELSEKEKNVAKKLKGLIKKFRFKNGDNKIHIGVIAQEVISAFESEGLNIDEYGLLYIDKWYEKNGEKIASYEDEAIEKTLLGINYSELLSFIISAI